MANGAFVFFRSSALTVVIGLTGGIASGKSVVSEMLARRGALIIDADKVGHEAYAPGSDCYREVVAAFGADIVAADGTIDRRALGAKVFSDDAERQRLQDIVWPWMRRTMEARLAGLRAEGVPVVVLEAAVLIEADWLPLVDQVWVVTVPPAKARQRIVERNGLTPEQADARIAAQLSNEERTRHAQVVIENDGSLDELEHRIDEAWRRLESSGAAAAQAGGRDA
ncbi:MAG TPA: dephospho-CoA kinase [Dehalococcoidia bacterium]|nr:dephospho-CoA kinase [Dehalococcoidia bacterium]